MDTYFNMKLMLKLAGFQNKFVVVICGDLSGHLSCWHMKLCPLQRTANLGKQKKRFRRDRFEHVTKQCFVGCIVTILKSDFEEPVLFWKGASYK